MYNIEELSQKIESQCKELPIYSSESTLYEPIKYIMEDGGKRMRPMLTLLAANIFNDNIEDAMSSAIALELYHNFSLLHDDIMDKASLRRGRPTVHIRWNENTAILSGDAMLILSYQTLSQGAPKGKLAELLDEFNKVTMEVCQGQQLDMEFENRESVSMSEYIDMICLKTAVFMASALKMGAISQGASRRQQQALYEFGINLGLAFQIQDDLLDTYGDQATFGKTIGGDIAVGKQTFLRISALKYGDEAQCKIITKSRNYDQVKEVYDALGIKELANRAIEGYFGSALDGLNQCFEDRERTQMIRDYAINLLKRKK